MKKSTVLLRIVLLATLLGVTVVVHAQEPMGNSPWSPPTVVRADEEGVTGPKLFAGDEGLWVTYEKPREVCVSRFRNTGQPQFLRDWSFGEAFPNGTLPLAIVPTDYGNGLRVIHSITADAGEQYLYRSLTLYDQGEYAGGGSNQTPLQPFNAGWRYHATTDDDILHVVWRNWPNGEVYYASGPDYGYSWEDPILVTEEFPQGTSPIVWAEGNAVVIIVDDTSNYPQNQSWSFTSLDRGTTWFKAPIGDGMSPSLTESRDSLFVLLNDGGSLQLYKSDDLGYMWLEYGDVTVPTMTEDHRLVARSDGYMAATWTDDHTIFVSTSFDGVDWQTEAVFSSDDVANVHPDVVFWKGRIFVVWQSEDRILAASRSVLYRNFLPIVTKSRWL